VKDKRIDSYIGASADFAKPILTHLRGLVHKACPGVTETIKWGFPHFDYQGIMCSMASFKQHAAFGFWKAKLMEDYDKVLNPKGETAMGHFGQIRSLKDLPPDKILLQYIKEAARLNADGVKVTRPAPAIKKQLTVPSDFKKALSKNKKAMAVFEGFSYSHRKDYLDWITEAKMDETRGKRISKTVEWLAEGKGRNWKYERKQGKSTIAPARQ
jgi:uncharacterized protein YdeI (YjbR/CyaY-like superfamily)